MQKFKFSKSSDENACDTKTQANYKTLLEKLIYLIIWIELNFGYLVFKLTQFMSNLHKKH